MTFTLWLAIFAQIAMGAFDTLFHHEGTERLAWRPEQRRELSLHGVRNLAYAIMFTALGWSEPGGGWAIALIALMAAELVITLWDFVEEDRTRRLPPSERVTHALLTLNYGVILALLLPIMVSWSQRSDGLRLVHHGAASWMCALAAVGVTVFGLRDLAAARRCRRLRRGDPAALAAALRERRRLLVTGGTGFVGSRLVAALAAAGHDVTVLTRAKANASGLPTPIRIVTSLDQIAADTVIDAIVNLAGEPISNGPWTLRKRRRIISSRVRTTRAVIRLIDRLEQKPALLISGSAIGWYGLREDQILTEANLGVACFSRQVCVAWEKAAMPARALGVRTILLRTGLVLDHDGGMLARMLAPFELGMGGRFGAGRQWISWIHRDDLVRLIVHAISTPTLSGPINATAPGPVTNRDFTAALGRALRRPALIPIPAWPLRLVLGSFADELLLGGQRVLPMAAAMSGFEFDHPGIDAALRAITGAAPDQAFLIPCQSASRSAISAERCRGSPPSRMATSAGSARR